MDDAADAPTAEGAAEAITVLLSDSPETEDRFGSHQRAADAIVKMIRDEAGGHAIALEGGWGSGKSTIVNLIKKQMPGDVFVFDAWAHEGDPLRRVFLETLIDHCVPTLPPKKQGEWREVREGLSKRKRSVETTSQPRVTRMTALVVALGLGYPVALMLLAAAIRQTEPWSWWQWIPTVYVVLPIALALSYWVRLAKRSAAGEDIGADLLQLWVHKASTVVRSDSTESPEPTSIEFQAAFTDLLDDYLDDRNKRLVIVLDNLDRIPHDQALSLWSTLRVFMDCWEAKKHDWVSRTWMLVPYDRPAVERLWRKDQLGDADTRPVPQKSESAPAAPGTPAAFLDKTFQIRFEVPPLILADWKEYLVELLRQAFPDHADLAEQHGVYRVSAIVAEEKGRAPTPRHLKLYVNDIGAIRRQHNLHFPLHHMAYYAILRRKGIDVRYGLIGGQIPEAAYATVLGDNVADHLAAMCFNTSDIDKARDLLLHGPIVQALSSGNSEDLRSLAQRRAFWPVAESLLPDLPSRWQGDPTATCNSARAIVASGIANASKPPEASRTVRLFAKDLANAAKWTAFDESVAEGAAALITLACKSEVTVAVVRELMAVELAEAQTEENVPEVVANWSHGLITLLQTPMVREHRGAFVNGLEIPGIPAGVVHICSLLAEASDTKDFWGKLRTTANGTDVLSSMQPDSSPTPWDDTKARAFEVLRRSQVQIPWEGFADACATALQVTHAVPAEHLLKILNALHNLPDSAGKKAATVRKKVVTTGHLTHHMHSCIGEEAAAAAAALLREIAMHTELATTPASVGKTAAGQQFIDKVLDDPSSHEKVVEALCVDLSPDDGSGFLAHLLDQQPKTAKLAVACLSKLKTDGQLVEVATHEFLRSKRRELSSLLKGSGLSYEVVLSDYVDDASILNALVSEELNRSELGFHRELIAAGATGDGSYSDWLYEQLTKVDQATWEDALSSNGELLRFLAEYREKVPERHMRGEFASAIRAFAGTVLSGQWSGETQAPHWTSVLGSLPDHARQVLGKDLLDLVKSPDHDELRQFFVLFKDVLAHASECSSPQHIVRLVFLPVIESDSSEAMTWVADTLEHSDEVLAKAPAEDVSTLKERVLEKLTGSDDTALTRIASALGVSQPSEPEEGEEEAED